jgi:uncharacterized cupin superfamily protein
MASQEKIHSLFAADAPQRTKPSVYPEPFASRMQGRIKRPLGDLFGLTNFGVNLTTIAPGGVSALRHTHSKQDEFVYVVSGTATLVTNHGTSLLKSGMCAGFKAGDGNAHQIRNDSSEPLIYLEVGDRSAGDQVTYPDDDIAASFVNGAWEFTHKDGTPY